MKILKTFGTNYSKNNLKALGTIKKIYESFQQNLMSSAYKLNDKFFH
jgi:hypothetical protein